MGTINIKNVDLDKEVLKSTMDEGKLGKIKQRVSEHFKATTEFVSSHTMLLNDVLTIVHTNGAYTVRVHVNKIRNRYNYSVDYRCGNAREHIVYMQDIDKLDDLDDCLNALLFELENE